MIVSRFWGGTKLGVGGLVRAYGGAAGQALDRATLVDWSQRVGMTVFHDHADTDRVCRALDALGAVEDGVEYSERVIRRVSLAIDHIAHAEVAIADATAGRAQVTTGEPN